MKLVFSKRSKVTVNIRSIQTKHIILFVGHKYISAFNSAAANYQSQKIIYTKQNIIIFTKHWPYLMDWLQIFSYYLFLRSNLKRCLLDNTKQMKTKTLIQKYRKFCQLYIMTTVLRLC